MAKNADSKRTPRRRPAGKLKMIGLRATAETLSVIDQAAKLEGVSRSWFVQEHVLAAARTVIAARA